MLPVARGAKGQPPVPATEASSTVAPLSTAAAALAIPVLRVSWKWQATVMPLAITPSMSLRTSWYSHADGVGQYDFVRARCSHAGCDPEYVLGLYSTLEWISEGCGESDGDT